MNQGAVDAASPLAFNFRILFKVLFVEISFFYRGLYVLITPYNLVSLRHSLKWLKYKARLRVLAIK